MPKGAFASTGLLFFGTVSSLLNKIIYGLEGRSRNGKIKFFRKPWASTCVMFIGMAFCLPCSFLLAWFTQGKETTPSDDSKQPLLGNSEQPLCGDTDIEDDQEKSTIALKDILLVAVPTLFDLIATVLMSIGLLSVTASVYQMLRGAEMLFAALFSVTILKRKLNRKHFIGLLCCFVGIVLVGGSSVLGGSSKVVSDARQIIVGMALIVLAQAVQAAQITVEDYVLSNIGMAPLTVVGWEGVWGSFFMLAILMPIIQQLPGEDGSGIHEDSIDTIQMIKHSVPAWTIPTVLVFTGLSLMLYNVTGMFVTDNIGAVARTVLESLRTLFVWLADLALWYIPLPSGLGKIGEQWDRSSYLQALGFAILVVGTVIYGRGDEEQHKKEVEEHESIAGIPKSIGNSVSHRMHSIASWTQGHIHFRRWKAGAEAMMRQVREEAEEERA